MTQRALIGIDIGGSKVLFALFNEKFRVLEEIKLKTHSELGEKRFTQAFGEAVKTLAGTRVKKTSPWSPRGSAAPAWSTPHRVVEKCPNVPFLVGYP